MKKHLYLAVLMSVVIWTTTAQNVGFGEPNPASKASIKGNLSVGSGYSTTTAPADGAAIEGNVGVGTASPDGKLDVVSTTDGVLIPRVALTAANSASPLTAPTTSELVYNTATSGSSPNQVTPGFYYWNGTRWVRLQSGNSNLVADNGLTRSNDTILLGGTLIQNTAVDQSTFNLNFGGTGLFGIGTTATGVKANIAPGALNTALGIGSFPTGSGKTGLAIDMANTSTSNAIDISNIGATAMQGIRINSTANGNGTGIRIGDATTLGTGINIRGGTGIIYNALSAATGTGITIGGTTTPLNGVDATTSGAGSGGIFQSSTAGAGAFGLSISGAYSRPALLPLTGLRGYTATNSTTASEIAYAVHGASTRYTGAGGTGTTTYGLFGSSLGNATSAGNGLMIGTYGTASVTNVGTSGAIGGLFNAASGSSNLALAANGGGDVYLGSTDADRPSNFTSGALSLGTGNTNTTRMFNTRISGTQTFVGTTSGTIGLSAPASITSYSLVLPNAQGGSGQVLKNDGSGNLSWQNDNNAGGTVTNIATGTGLTGGPITTTGTISMANMAANTIKGNNTGASVAPTDIAVGNNTVLGRKGGNIVAEQVATAQIEDAAVTNAKITNDAVNSAKIQDNTVADADLTNSGVTAGTYTKVTVNAKGRVTSGTTLAASDIPAGSDNYIRNGTSPQTADFNITGTGTAGNLVSTNLTTAGGSLQLSGGGWGMDHYIDTDNNSNDNYTWYANGTGTSNIIMRLTDGGNLGIGTSTPGATLNVIHPTFSTTPTKPSGNWAAIIENNQDATDSRNGLAVATRWGGDESTVFQIASYWNGSSQTYTPFFSAKGDRQIGIGTGVTSPNVPLAIGGNGADIYGTDTWVERNIHVQGNENINGVSGRRGRLRVGTAWQFVGLYADGVSDGVNTNNDLVLGASSGLVRIGPNAGGQNLRVSGLEGTGARPVYANASGVLIASPSATQYSINTTASGNITSGDGLVTTPNFAVVAGELLRIEANIELRNVSGSGNDRWRVILEVSVDGGTTFNEISRTITATPYNNHGTYNYYPYLDFYSVPSSGNFQLRFRMQRFDSDDTWQFRNLRVFVSKI